MTAETPNCFAHARIRSTRFGLGAVLSMLFATASAHHSFAMFDARQSVTLHGVVKEFRWSNPHVFIQLLATDEGGVTAGEWSIEMTSPEHLVRTGWKPGTLKPGDKVTLNIHPMHDGTKGGQYVNGNGPNGPLIGAPTPSQQGQSH